MRLHPISTARVIALVAWLAGTTSLVYGDGYGSVVYYYPAPQVVYYRPYAPMYYSRPMYHSTPMYSSYSAPCVYYVRPVYCEPTYSYPSSNSGGYSSEANSYQRSDSGGHSSGQPSWSQPTTTATVGAYDNRFTPETVNVQLGTTVRWVNHGHHPHTVTANDGSWDSGDIQPGASYSATFNHPGTYYYYCRHHTQDRMQGVVVVGSATDSGNGSSRSTGY
jgi:plastocyanin